jgi:hypothetical protein
MIADIEQAHVPRNVAPINFPNMEPVAQVLPHILGLHVLNIIVFVARAFEKFKEVDTDIQSVS